MRDILVSRFFFCFLFLNIKEVKVQVFTIYNMEFIDNISTKDNFWYNRNMYTKNEEELQSLGERLGYLLEKNDVLILTGETWSQEKRPLQKVLLRITNFPDELRVQPILL